jgi:hypothetical protein
LFLFPGTSMLSVVWLLGVYEIAFGISTTILGFRLHGIATQSGTPQSMRPV